METSKTTDNRTKAFSLGKVEADVLTDEHITQVRDKVEGFLKQRNCPDHENVAAEATVNVYKEYTKGWITVEGFENMVFMQAKALAKTETKLGMTVQMSLDLDLGQGLTLAELIPDPSASQLEQERRWLMQAVRDVIVRLPGEQRAVAYLIFFRGMSVADIAREKKVPYHKIAYLFQKAKQSIQQDPMVKAYHER